MAISPMKRRQSSAGLRPLLVNGSRHNIKITPGDLPFAEWVLQQRNMA